MDTSISLEPASTGYLNIYGKTPFLSCFCPVPIFVGWFYIVYMQLLLQIGTFQNRFSWAEKQTSQSIIQITEVLLPDL